MFVTLARELSSPTLFSRLRRWAPIRLAGYVVSILAVAIVVNIAGKLLIPPLPSPLYEPMTVAKNLLLLIAVFTLYPFLVRVFERRAASETGIRRHWSGFLVGSAIGALLIGVIYLIMVASGIAHSQAGSGLEGLLVAVLRPLSVAMLEELLFRGVLLRITEEVCGTTVAIVVSAVLFGLAHAANPGATPFTIFALTVDLGILLSLAYVLTRNIWLAVGIHMTWNFMQGFVVGTEVSGSREPSNLFTTSMTGPDLLTGGNFGIEGSLISILVSLAASTVLAVLIARKRDWQPTRLRWRKEE
jgi:uncharacterized protein